METFMGYPRCDGTVGIRNYVLVISLVQCANSTVNKIALQCGVPAITIDTGCGEFAQQAERTNLGLICAGTSPNVYGVLLVSLGCQWTDPELMYNTMKAAGKQVYHLCIQEEHGMQSTIEKA